MRQTEANSNVAMQVRLFLAVMILAAARLSAQEQAQVQRQIMVSLEDRKLALLEDGVVTRVFPVAVGKESSPSPSGSFKVVNRVSNPTYYHPGKVIPAGASNPLGNRWIGLSQKGYGIHGTNEPKSIGKAASHGCIRMARKDLEQLFEIVRPGDAVEIRAERDEETAQIFGTASEPVVMATATTEGDGSSAAAR
ncbi:MAG TPA: L,D-transpeptidase [Terriglobales bacterium]|nr:L,D-transpeptidase [Terriglobales bacterium]